METWAAVVGAAVIAVLGIWEIWICEGIHLGSRFVVWLYDVTAPRYEDIKQFDTSWELQFLGRPFVNSLMGFAEARILDVGAGTGRLTRAALATRRSKGLMINLEPSRRMIEVGRSLVQPKAADWVQGMAEPLPFPEGSFDVVSCLEVLEFTPRPVRTLAELVRVLRPGGWLLITNRIGWRARVMLGHSFRKETFVSLLKECGLEGIEVYPWQVEYDLVWAQKSTTVRHATSMMDTEKHDEDPTLPRTS